jgi:thiamine biosynthesis lipoprotein
MLSRFNPRNCISRFIFLWFAFSSSEVVRSQSAEDQLFSASRAAMGTTFTIYLYSSDQVKADTDFEAAFDEIERIEEALSNYRPSSELSRINRLAAQQSVTTDPEVFDLLQTSFDYSRRSGGAFDITVGPLMQAWGFFRKNGQYPTRAQLLQARARVGWKRVDLDPEHRTVRFDVPGMEFDMGGIGKGYAVDRVIELLRDAGVKSALVDAGSSTLYALGAPPGKDGWKVLVPQPGDRSHAISEVVLHDNSLSTSGSYEKFFRLNGRTYCHIMDPRTGAPVQGMLQTTVIAPTGTESDALSTTMFVMGPAKGRKLLESIPNTSAVWITHNTNEPHFEQWHWPGRLCQTADHCVTAGEENGTR